VGAVVVSLASPLPLLAPRHRRLSLARLVHQDLLRPALLAAEALVSPARTGRCVIKRRLPIMTRRMHLIEQVRC